MSRVIGPRFAVLPEWVLDAPISDKAIRVYCVLARYANSDSQAYPGRKTMAKRVGCSVDSVDRALKELETINALEVLPRYAAGGNRTTNDYRLLEQEPHPRPHPQPQERGGVAAPVRLGGRVGAAAEEREPVNENQLTKESPSAPLGVSLCVSPASSVRTTQAPSDVVIRLCDLLADLIADNGSKRPNITDHWLIECDRLIRIDGLTPAQVERAIRWCQADPFWRSNILSMPKLRAQYDKLRLAAKRHIGPAPMNKTDQRALQAMAWAAAQEAR